MSLNKVMVIGNVGKEPEMRFTPSGTPVTNFSVATNESFTNSEGEKKERTEWFNIVCWNKLAETTNQYVYKGMMVYVEGRQQTKKWNAEDGSLKYRTEVVANRVDFLSKQESVDESDNEPVDTTQSIDGLSF